MGYQTRVDWCDSTYNPITGCLHGCNYCYARGIAQRFGGATYYSINEQGKIIESKLIPPDCMTHVLDEPIMKDLLYQDGSIKSVKAPYPYYFEPTFHRYLLDKPQQWKKPRNIFVCSMADLFGAWVPDEWIMEVFKACDEAPQHRYLFLTKNPLRYKDLMNLLPVHRHLPNVAEMWFGHSYTGIGDYHPIPLSSVHNKFVSIEPLMHDLSERDMMVVAATNDWIIIGAETGNRKGRVIPNKSWVDGIAYYAKKNSVPIFMKESLREIMGNDFRQEFPWDTPNRTLSWADANAAAYADNPTV